MSFIKHEVSVFFTALMFYTRLPCPKWVDHSSDMLNKATRYLPAMGWIVGGASGMIFYGSVQVFPISVSVILSMVTGVLITGAFHEDGWADVCDGFGGGWTKERILTIMKDSSIGAYGAIGLVFILLFKYILLYEIAISKPNIMWCLVLLSSHSLSRLMAVTMIFTHDYVRKNEDSKAKPVAKKLPINQFFVTIVLAVMPLLLFQSPIIWLSIIPLLLIKIYLGYYFKKWIGGYTGDCLGATQQLSEVVFYLTFLVLWKYI